MSSIKELREKLKFISDEPYSSEVKTSEQESSNLKALEEQANWPNIDRQTKHLANKRFESDTQKRDTLSTWAAVLVSFWLISVLLILVGNTNTYKLESNVLIALLATTTLNVLGLMFIVLKGLFGSGINRN